MLNRMGDRQRTILQRLEPFAFPLFLALVIASVLLFREELWGRIADRETLQQWVSEAGIWAPALFVGVQTVQVVVFMIPGDVAQAAAGYIFGVWQGILYSVLGIAIGSGFNYLVGSRLGEPFLKGVLGEERMNSFLSVARSYRGRLGFFLFFLIPGIPKDVLCYVGGTARLGFASFLLISMVARLPGIVGSAFIGDAAAREQWQIAAALLAVAAILSVTGLLTRRRLEGLIHRVTERDKSRREE
ncbi:MAG: TVP38/TMEM64 family protein [Alkalispirochaetaceae bacterium]